MPTSERVIQYKNNKLCIYCGNSSKTAIHPECQEYKMVLQRKRRLEHIAAGYCAECSEPRVNARYCEKHRTLACQYKRDWYARQRLLKT